MLSDIGNIVTSGKEFVNSEPQQSDNIGGIDNVAIYAKEEQDVKELLKVSDDKSLTVWSDSNKNGRFLHKNHF